jgi:hypothetical protein
VPKPQKTVFISCGQYAQEEIDLGKLACELIEEITPFKAYFAEYQATLKALSENVLSRLYESVGLIVIMHHRGKIEGRDITRASVWIEQEIAIATMMEQVLRRPLHVALFTQPGISIEGIRQQLQLNPVEFRSPEDVATHLRKILPKWREPLYVSDEELRKQVDSVYLSIAVQNGANRDLTIGMRNDSDVDVEVKSIVLWSKGKRVCTPIYPPTGQRWSVPARSNVPIQFTANDDLVLKLASIHEESPPVGMFPRIFRVDVTVELQCEILGCDRKFEETTKVQVDYRNRQIMGL